MNPYEAYMKEIAQPMRDELTQRSFEDLTTARDVDQFMSGLGAEETAFVVVNSVCGCAAGLARPAAVTVAEQNPIRPDRRATVFAGQDKEATERMREYVGQAPSSPSMALFKGDALVHFIPREHIEGRDINDIMMDIKEAFDTHCA
ncbi:BrxA/BrxB family bacilliredoxin [Salinicoccus sp. ID82-1]|uniref:BrxA/BrxB family bacilliredoxin n=1 Tax=Salinicoccus cyprini TaxID=2493691 RepID=A0A558AZ72_9STAP|nr:MULTISPECIES: BrxA/BrxB family bacilliredoxin [Salinicoccus]MCG1009126.1 BrxA/BrxB family bacilliredoxin [Salinicoccus sp. ID82-1]TVT29570.1 BrxA/BrxB family bacilliredoxin [Salinicoccus cyprini]